MIITWSFLRSSSISNFCRFSKAASDKIYKKTARNEYIRTQLPTLVKVIKWLMPCTKQQTYLIHLGTIGDALSSTSKLESSLCFLNVKLKNNKNEIQLT